MRMNIPAGVVLLCLSFSSAAVEVTYAFPGAFDGARPEARKQVAESLLREVTAVKSLVPAPAEDDRSWIAGELEYLRDKRDAVDYQVRFGNLYNSPRFQGSQLYDHLAAIEKGLHCAAAGGSKEDGNEMFCWSRVSLLLLDTTLVNNALQILASREVINPQQFRPAMDALPMVFAANGRGILELVIGQYLAQEVKR